VADSAHPFRDRPGSPKEPSPPIQRIEVDGLFNTYSYVIEPPPRQHPEHARLLILYGDNGAGKTTILEALYHLLSPARNRGHRTHLAQVAFKRFSVSLADGSEVVASRSHDDKHGGFLLQMLKGGQIIGRHRFRRDEAGRFVDPADRTSEYRLYHALASLDLELHNMRDDRSIAISHGNFETHDEDATDVLYRRALEAASWTDLALPQRSGKQGALKSLPVEKALQRFKEWLSQQALEGAKSGNLHAHDVIVSVVRHLATFGESEDSPQLDALAAALSRLQERNRAQSQFGLLPELHSGELAQLLNEAPVSQRSLLSKIVKPYMDGLEARLDANESIHSLLRTLLQHLNDFLTDKRIELSVSEGLSVYARSGDRIEPGRLSSGERQLLLLLCSAVPARDRASVFMIDEPELSLNIKWQRKLVDALLQCSNSQLILATHSIELLTKFQDCVVPLRQHETRR
jgi:ABC-type Na+ transport system ATPase subunit NatA